MTDAYFEYRPNPEAKVKFRIAALAAMKEVFELDIKPAAVAGSPVTPEGMRYNIEKGKKGVAVGGTGTNRRSIDTEVHDTPEGPLGSIFTQSGYGGYLEMGTSKMRPQPYIYPAFERFREGLQRRLKRLLVEFR